ncbi:CG14903 [Drosophila busckii]|uniref:peptidyl-tRNA hydrolase n=1 Tax=Drosophila busckii TaxID=30019 RepID=A0A0M3QYX4_DROBS|nr:putative peptidyl-tRNA hydrolase PTRHD1 [Drosophila busckii]ALC48433.1 CG14903 [Drosophila busckii]
MTNIVQYIVLRGDLRTTLNWPLGAVIAQCCHATAATMSMFATDADTKTYLEDMDHMHKVVLEVKNEGALLKLSEKLEENDIEHKLWIEQPENIPTCIALKPYKKEVVHQYVKNLHLLR